MFNLKRSLNKLNAGRALYLGEDVQLLRPEIDDEVRNESDGTVRVFVFETLMNAQVRQPVLKGDVPTDADYIPNFKEINVESEGGTNYHTIIPDLGNSIVGLVLHVDEHQLSRLDWWEDQYDRIKCMLGSGRKAYVYVIKIENMKDMGKNKEVELQADDLEQIASISSTMEGKDANAQRRLNQLPDAAKKEMRASRDEELAKMEKTKKGFHYSLRGGSNKKRLGYFYIDISITPDQDIAGFDGIPGLEIAQIKYSMSGFEVKHYVAKVKEKEV